MVFLKGGHRGIELVNYAAYLTPSFYKEMDHLLFLILATLVVFAVNNGYDIYPASWSRITYSYAEP